MTIPPVDAAAVGRAARLLLEGKLVAFPTETVYGLGADADQVDAVRSIFTAKRRPADHPLIVHVARLNAAEAWAADLPETARRLAAQFWPGPLTMVVARSARAHDALTGGQASIGLRCPSHPWAQALLHELGALAGDPNRAIAAPSANRFGRISTTSAQHVRADLGEKPHGAVDLILDGGACPFGIESTIVDLTADRVRVLRPGSVTRADLAQALGRDVDLAQDDDAQAPRASGRLERHYAPGKPLELVDAERIRQRAQELGVAQVAVLAAGAELPGVALWLRAAADPADYAHRLYDDLHRMDASAARRLLVQRPPHGPEWAALADRLRRAAAAARPGPFYDAD